MDAVEYGIIAVIVFVMVFIAAEAQKRMFLGAPIATI